jgi:DNA-binding transcriptional LysR family regulator
MAGPMNFQQLETLACLARLKSFHAAAEALRTTQPSVSLRIKTLEQELGVRLLDRGRGGVSPTAAGRDCLAYAEQILAWRTELCRRAAPDGPLRGRVSLGVSEIIADTWLTRLMQALAARHPGVVVDATVDLTPRLTRGLDDGSFDVVLVGSYRLATVHPTLDLGHARFRWMAAPALRLPRRVVTPRDLQETQLITWPAEAAIHGHIAEWFARDGAFPSRRLTCNSAVTMARLAVAGVGVALLPEPVVERELATGDLMAVQTDPAFPAVDYRAVYVAGRQSLGGVVARMAAEVSGFARRSRK